MRKSNDIVLLSVEEIIQILNGISSDASPKWGKMNISQMMRHCAYFIDLYTGKTKVNIIVRILGRCFGFIFLSYVMKLDPKKTPKNLSTSSFMKVTSNNLNINDERKNLIKKMVELEKLNDIVMHPIYGKMSKEKTLFLIIHHTMHHLNQFGLIE